MEERCPLHPRRYPVCHPLECLRPLRLPQQVLPPVAEAVEALRSLEDSAPVVVLVPATQAVAGALQAVAVVVVSVAVVPAAQVVVGPAVRVPVVQAVAPAVELQAVERAVGLELPAVVPVPA